mgnify:CR=1 FL=1
MGDRIPADVRIIEANDLEVSDYVVSGEIMPRVKSPECTDPDHPLKTANLVFMGTLCVKGSGKGIVIATGDRSLIGVLDRDTVMKRGFEPSETFSIAASHDIQEAKRSEMMREQHV